MKNPFAAYNLGLNVVMLSYNERYAESFPFDPRARGDQGIHDCLGWILDDCISLATASPTDATRSVVHLVADLKHALGSKEQLQWKRVVALAHAAKKMLIPPLLPWHRLGQCVGVCFYDLLRPDTKHVLTSLPSLVQAARAKELPRRIVNRVDVLQRLAMCDDNDAATDPCRALQSVLQEPAIPFPTSEDILRWRVRPGEAELLDPPGHPPDSNRRDYLEDLLRAVETSKTVDLTESYSNVVGQIERLDFRIKAALHEIDDPILLVAEEPGQVRAILDGKSYPISYNQSLILRAVYEAQGEFVTGEELKRRHQELGSANLSRERRRLPEDLRRLLKGEPRPGGGYRWDPTD